MKRIMTIIFGVFILLAPLLFACHSKEAEQKRDDIKETIVKLNIGLKQCITENPKLTQTQKEYFFKRIDEISKNQRERWLK